MSKFNQFWCVFMAVCLTACSVATPITPSPYFQSSTQPAQGISESDSSTPPDQDTPVVVLKTGNPEFALTAFFEKGETLIAMTETDAAGEVVDVTGAIYIAPDGRSIAVYFENGLPIRAIAEGHLIEFYNFTDSTVDVVIVAPDGTVTTQAGIPFDAQKIYQVNRPAGNNSSGGHLAALSLATQDKDIDWIQFASTALGAFSCAATIASGGTLSVLFGVGCAFFVYTTYFQATEQEIPVIVEGGDNVVSAINCGSEIARKDAMAISDCGKLVIDAAKSIQESSSQIYEKQKRVVEEVKLKPSIKPVENSLSCFDPSLTPEERANCGQHSYESVNEVTSGNCFIELEDGSKSKSRTQTSSKTFYFSVGGVENVTQHGLITNLQKTSPNTYVAKYGEAGTQTLVFDLSGFAWSSTDPSCSFLVTAKLIR
jgi:hypothetical protein